MKAKMIFLSYLDISYSRSSVYLDENNFTHFSQSFFKIDLPILSACKKLWSIRNLLRESNTVIIIMNPCHIFAPLVRFITNQTIILDAGWPLSDSKSTSKSLILRSFKQLTNNVLDYLALNSATCVLSESEAQINQTAKKFGVSQRKMIRMFTGLNESLYKSAIISHEQKINILADLGVKKESGYIFFRGKFTKESGLEMISHLSMNLLSHLQFVILTNKIPNKIVFGENVLVLTGHLSESQISALYFGASVCIGQLSDDKRLLKTIPHKAFEAGFFGKPYVTVDTGSMRELYPFSDQVAYITFFNEIETAKIINSLHKNEKLKKTYSINIMEQYNKVANQAILQKKFNDVAYSLVQFKK